MNPNSNHQPRLGLLVESAVAGAKEKYKFCYIAEALAEKLDESIELICNDPYYYLQLKLAERFHWTLDYIRTLTPEDVIEIYTSLLGQEWRLPEQYDKDVQGILYPLQGPYVLQPSEPEDKI